MPDGHTAKALAELASRYLRSLRLDTGIEAVLVVTDHEGSYVGVSSTEDSARTAAVLEAALRGAEHQEHPQAGVIDVEGNESDGGP